jgi:hypothetical protein
MTMNIAGFVVAFLVLIAWIVYRELSSSLKTLLMLTEAIGPLATVNVPGFIVGRFSGDLRWFWVITEDLQRQQEDRNVPPKDAAVVSFGHILSEMN